MSRFKNLLGYFCAILSVSCFSAECIILMSDSTAVNYLGKSNPIAKTASWVPMAGWGQYAADDVLEKVIFINRSGGGHSSKTYAESILPDAKQFFQQGGWLLLSFGSNDVRPNANFERTTRPEDTYPLYLGKIAEAATAAGMKVVIISPLPFFSMSEGHFCNSLLAPYAEASGKLAADRKYFFIDAYSMIQAYFKDMPEMEIKSYYMYLKPGESANWPKGSSDPLHFTEKGALMVWNLIRTAIDKDIPELANLFKPVLK